MLPWFEHLHSFVVVVATVPGVVAVVQNLCMAGPVHVQVCVVQAAVVWVAFVMALIAAMDFVGVAIVSSVIFAFVSAVTVEMMFAVAVALVAFVVAFVVSQVILIGVATAVEFVVVFVVVGVVIVVALAAFVAVVVVVLAWVVVAVKVACVASGDSTWVWVPSIVECMGMAWA